MAPRSKQQNAASSGSESDSDAPEAVSLSQSKKTIQKLDSSRENAIKAGRQSQRLRNQQRDKALKERAEKNKEVVTEKGTGKGKVNVKGKGKEKEEQIGDEDEEGSEVSEEEGIDEDLLDGDPNSLEARMLRAMKEAQDEQSGSDDEEDADEEFEGFGGVQLDEDEESGDEDGDSDAVSLENDVDDDEDEDEEDGESDPEDDDDDDDEEEAFFPPKKSQKIKFNPDHLPDEIFEAAFASQSTKRTFTDSDTDAPNKTSASRPSKKRKSNAKSDTPKDVVVGSRAIRVLPTSNHPQTPSTMPSRKVKKFIDRTLGLKAGKQRGKGWERRPVNVGVLRRAGGPAANFVRQQA